MVLINVPQNEGEIKVTAVNAGVILDKCYTVTNGTIEVNDSREKKLVLAYVTGASESENTTDLASVEAPDDGDVQEEQHTEV